MRMAQLHDYVFSTPSNSPEREQRLNELNEDDLEDLYDYKVGLLSGRIKETDYINNEQEEQQNMMFSFKEWKQLEKSRDAKDTLNLINFRKQYPAVVSDYEKRQVMEDTKRREIMSIKDTSERQAAIAKNIALFQ